MKEKREVVQKEFATRERFLEVFDNFVNELIIYDRLHNITKDPTVEETYWSLSERFTKPAKEELSGPEKELFDLTFSLFCLKNGVGVFGSVPEFSRFATEGDNREFSIETEGPISVGKTTLTRFLAENIGAQTETERFLPSDNAFLAPSYTDAGLMLRTQLNFLLKNIALGIGGKFSEGRSIRDTSVWSDIYTFMEWRVRNGQVSEEERETYMKVVYLLEPIIPKPDVLMKLFPTSVERLFEGLQIRIAANPEERAMEKAITYEDLEIVTNASKDSTEVLRTKHGINVMTIEVDPVEIYRKQELRYTSLYAIRQELGILGEFLVKDPKEAADEILAIFAEAHEPRLIIVHSKSMFSGKTTSLYIAGEKLGPEKVTVFQPRAAIRYGQEHMVNMITRNRKKMPAITLENNKLEEILVYIKENGITPKDKPFIFVDEVMLFTGTEDDKAIGIFKELQKQGFNVVVDGIDYTFQEKPFKFIHELIGETKIDNTWFEIELATKCKYCEKDAKGTRRLTLGGEIADYSDTDFQAGENYEPVCCEEHESCVNQPKDFVRQPLPTEV